MSTVIASSTLANGLLNNFNDTYSVIRNRQADGRLSQVMDLSGVNATNRHHEFAYFTSAPHMGYWRRGESIPRDAMDSVDFQAVVYEWGLQIPWLKWDRDDDQTGSLMDVAKGGGQSAGLLPERYFFDLLVGTPTTLPAVPTAPDGAAFFATTAGGVARFGASSGNLLTGTGVASTATILADYYSGIQQFMLFQDTKGQPMLSPEMVASGVLIIHSVADLDVFEAAFLQKRQGVLGPDNTTDAVTSVQVSNVVQDASRNVQLWASPRIATGDWYMFLLNPPKKPTFLLNREGLQEQMSLMSDNNSDRTRNTAEESVQWYLREGAGIALPYGALKINN